MCKFLYYVLLLNMDVRFELANSLFVCGPSKAGKSHWVVKLIENRHLLFVQPPAKIYWFYGTWQPQYASLKEKGVHMIDGVQESDIANIENGSMVILDDLVSETENSKAVTALFTKHVHHRDLFLVYITQNFYHQSKEARMRHLNSHYILFFKNPRDKTQPSMLARQMFPGRSSAAFAQMFELATEKPHGYLLIDLRQNAPNDIRLRTNIFPDEYPSVVYK